MSNPVEWWQFSNVKDPQGFFQKSACLFSSQYNFQSMTTQKFVIDWAVAHLIYECLDLANFLSDHQTLGTHTDIIRFQPGITTSFRWMHPGACSFGFDVSKQCLCKRLKTRLWNWNSRQPHFSSILSMQASSIISVGYHMKMEWQKGWWGCLVGLERGVRCE